MTFKVQMKPWLRAVDYFFFFLVRVYDEIFGVYYVPHGAQNPLKNLNMRLQRPMHVLSALAGQSRWV